MKLLLIALVCLIAPLARAESVTASGFVPAPAWQGDADVGIACVGPGLVEKLVAGPITATSKIEWTGLPDDGRRQDVTCVAVRGTVRSSGVSGFKIFRLAPLGGLQIQ